MGFGQRNCAVFGCHNSGKRLDKWSQERYEVHNSLIRGETPCVCECNAYLSHLNSTFNEYRYKQTTIKQIPELDRHITKWSASDRLHLTKT